MTINRIGIFILSLLFGATCKPMTADQQPQRAEPPAVSVGDLLVFVDGETLKGKLERTDDKSVTFKSDMAGEVKVDWKNIKELRTTEPFAVAEKGIKFGRHEDIRKVPQGVISATNETITVSGTGRKPSYTVPVSAASIVIDEPTFLRALQTPGPLREWKGAASLGASLVLATQNNQTITSAVSLTRSLPSESWMQPENRTSLDFSSSFGKLTQPGQPYVKTSMFHAHGERDEYFNSNCYVFAEAAFDHNYSQGLDLQHTYGVGVGWTVVKETNSTVDLKGELTYVHQQFQAVNLNQELVGSVFSEGWERNFIHRMVFKQQASFAPAWNNLNAYTGTGSLNLELPVRKAISISFGALDTFLNDPPPGFKKNSFQASTSLTYIKH